MAGQSSAHTATFPIDKVKQMNEREFEVLLQEFWDFSLFHGNMMKIHTDPITEPHKGHTSSTALVPTPFSRVAYERALAIQPLYNTLYHKVAMDYEFLTKTLESVAKNDEFMRRHLDIYNRLHKQNISDRVNLALNRSDYMTHVDADVIKQVEFNTMSSAASGVNRAASLWHRYMTGTLLNLDNSHIPENTATPMLARGMVKAWELYNNSGAAIAYIVSTDEFNFADHRSLQYEIHKLNPRIRVMRAVFATLNTNMSVDADRRLFIDGTEVAVVYYRCAYLPSDYDGEEMWRVRYDLERSLAVKCPTVGYVLAGTKRVQQVLAAPGVLEKWLDAPQCERIRETFIGLHSFARDEGGEESVRMALEKPTNFVMKPQRDGGGNNVYNEDILEKINTMDLEQLAAFTLMEKIHSPPSENYIVSSGQLPPKGEVLSELSLFGSLVVSDGVEVMNEGAGFLFRSKQSDRNEGGLMRGTSSLDSPWLL